MAITTKLQADSRYTLNGNVFEDHRGHNYKLQADFQKEDENGYCDHDHGYQLQPDFELYTLDWNDLEDRRCQNYKLQADFEIEADS